MIKSRSLKLNISVLYIFVPLLFLLTTNSCSNTNKKQDHQIQTSIRSFIDLYDDSLVDSLTISNADSVGKLLLSLPNSKTTRNLIKDFIDKTKAKKEYSDKLLIYASKAEDSTNIANALFYIGKYFEQTLIYDSAYSYYIRAENIFYNAKDSLRVSEVLYSKAVIFSMHGIYTEAKKQILKSL
jgi:hypothetical protein